MKFITFILNMVTFFFKLIFNTVLILFGFFDSDDEYEDDNRQLPVKYDIRHNSIDPVRYNDGLYTDDKLF